MAVKSNTLKGPVELLRESWEFYQSKFVVFVLITLFMSLLGFLDSFTSISSINPSIGVAVIVFVLTMLFATWGQAALIYATRDKNAGFMQSLRLGFAKLIPLFLLELLSVLIIIGGFILLIIPGIIFMVWFAFSQFTLINENLGVINSLKGSRALVRGRWWAVFGRLLILVLFSMLFSVPALVLGFYNAGALALNFVNTAVSAVLTPIMTIYLFLLYTNLKSTERG